MFLPRGIYREHLDFTRKARSARPVEVLQELLTEFLMAVVAGRLNGLERRDDGSSVLCLGCLAKGLRGLVDFSVVTLELAHIRADKGHDAKFFGYGRLRMVGYQRGCFFYQRPVLH